ncbi:MAG: YaaA family protein [Chloroflexi bacterium]|nr:YaaA family protein [Chloroflexota bacterium]
MIILLHSSKTMRTTSGGTRPLGRPALLAQAQRLDAYLKTLTPAQLAQAMQLSPALAEKTHALIAAWTPGPEGQSPAVDSFTGDIYSGLHAGDLSPADRDYAGRTLYILSGLYGVLRPDDGICPYRLEMGYRLPDPPFANLYTYWGDAIANCLPPAGPVVNLAAGEYAQVVTRYLDAPRCVTPRFLTLSPKTGQPTFVVVHAKIARGALARWLITGRIQDPQAVTHFDQLGYAYDQALSSPGEPTFVCQTFGGKGLSIRLQ